MNLSTVKWAQWDKTQSREKLCLFICVCIAMCTIVAHNSTYDRPHNFPSYPPDNYHCSRDVYLREGGSWWHHNMTILWQGSRKLHNILYVVLQKSKTPISWRKLCEILTEFQNSFTFMLDSAINLQWRNNYRSWAATTPWPCHYTTLWINVRKRAVIWKQVLQLTINHKALYLGISCFVGFSMKFARSLLLSLLSKQLFK